MKKNSTNTVRFFFYTKHTVEISKEKPLNMKILHKNHENSNKMTKKKKTEQKLDKEITKQHITH